MGKVNAKLRLDPRVGLLLLVVANVISFSNKAPVLELAWVAFLVLLMAVCGCPATAVKFAVGFAALLLVQGWLLPHSPAIIATSFSIFANYLRRLYTCLMMGVLLVKTTPMRNFIVAMRRLHLPQKLIVAISVTLRYFPAIREETGYIRDAMRLREIHGPEKIECLVIPLMISATGTAEELSAAAVTRGIENPAPKTSVITLRCGPFDWACLAVGLAFALAALLSGFLLGGGLA